MYKNIAKAIDSRILDNSAETQILMYWTIIKFPGITSSGRIAWRVTSGVSSSLVIVRMLSLQF